MFSKPGLVFLLLIFFQGKAWAQREKNIISIGTGMFQLSKKFNFYTVHNRSFSNPYNFTFGASYLRRIGNSPFLYGAVFGNIHIKRDLENLELPFNNPEREYNIPTVSIRMRQNFPYLLPSFAYQPRLAGDKLRLNLQVGFGFYYQLYPKVKTEIKYPQPGEPADTRFSFSIDEQEDRFGALLTFKAGLSYKIDQQSSIGANYTLYRTLQRKNSTAIFPITSHLTVNHANYSIYHWAFLNGHSLTLSYSYAF